MNWIDAFLNYMDNPIHWVEAAATITGIICVYLNTKENIWAWPIGIVSVGLAIIVYYDSFLFADLSLHIIYVILGFYGWYQWLYGGTSKKNLAITLMDTPWWAVSIVVGVLGVFVMGWFFDNYTQADLAYWDAFTTSFSLVAQIQLAKKKLENWLFWIVVDIIAVGVYFYKGLYFFTFLYMAYLVLATVGYIQWKKKKKEQDLSNYNSMIKKIGSTK